MVLNFINRVAIVTGAGNGLGREYALYLASKGAKVVVNDLNVNLKGQNFINNINKAEEVKKQIIQRGGIAIADNNSVESGQQIIKTAINKFGKVDILVNSAGIIRDISFHKMKDQDWNKVIQTHLIGTYKCCKSVWNHMRDQKYGRIVNVTSSSGLYGSFGQANYSAAKLGIHGLTLALAKEGIKYNINVNSIAPIAASRMLETIKPKDVLQKLRPEFVSPLVGYLSHESSKQTGNVYEVGGKTISKLRWQRSEGVFFENISIQNIASNINKINSYEGKNDYPTEIEDTFNKLLNRWAK